MALLTALSNRSPYSLHTFSILSRNLTKSHSCNTTWREFSSHVCRGQSHSTKGQYIFSGHQNLNCLKTCRRYVSGKLPGEEAGRFRSATKGLMRGFVIAGAIAIGARLYIGHLKRQRDAENNFNTSSGKALIGGSWELTDLDGKKISHERFANKWYLLYFGFTHCPDVCPDELEKISGVMDTLAKDDKMPKLQTVFVSVDPERDTPEVMRPYCEEFHKDLIGVVGSQSEVEEVTRTFRVYYSKGPKDEDGDYIVDHTIITYLMSPDNEMEHYYTQRITQDVMTEDIRRRIIGHQKKNMTAFQQFLDDPWGYLNPEKKK